MLDNALDCGISEWDFWNMTFAELDRLFESKARQHKLNAQQKASDNYILAMLIGRAFASSMSKDATFPELHEVYPSLFSEEIHEEIKQERLDQLSALRFKQFANFHNKRYEEVANDK